MTAGENRPTHPGAEAPVDAFAEMATKLRALYEFVDARAAEGIATP
ncbi:hypothetical protein AB0K86_19945 [Streptomyces clavifer]